MKFGLLGKNISHSRSKEVYENLLNKKIEYKLFDISDSSQIKKLEEYFLEVDYLNITSPYKKFFINDVVSTKSIKKAKSLNTIKFDSITKKFEAINSDYLALVKLIPHYFNVIKEQYNQEINKVLILGDGSISQLLQVILSDMNCDYFVMSRKIGNYSQDYFTKFYSKDTLVVNCISRDIIFNFKSSDLINFLDLNYNVPKHNELVGKKFLFFEDGFSLLNEQAKINLSFWNI